MWVCKVGNKFVLMKPDLLKTCIEHRQRSFVTNFALVFFIFWNSFGVKIIINYLAHFWFLFLALCPSSCENSSLNLRKFLTYSKNTSSSWPTHIIIKYTKWQEQICIISKLLQSKTRGRQRQPHVCQSQFITSNVLLEAA